MSTDIDVTPGTVKSNAGIGYLQWKQVKDRNFEDMGNFGNAPEFSLNNLVLLFVFIVSSRPWRESKTSKYCNAKI